MRWGIKALQVLIIVFFFTACKNEKEDIVVIEQPLLDTIFCNTFEGIIPCPDCPGIESSIRIYKDSTISRTIYYQDKNELPTTKVGTWKLKDSVFTATFDREKLFYRIKDYNHLLRVGSDLKEVKGEFAADYILHKKIESLKQLNTYKSTMLFVSDHGESLGENNLYMHGIPMSIAPKEQYEIPFIVWVSDTSKMKVKSNSR